MNQTELAPIDLDPSQVMQFARIALTELTEAWDLDSDAEPRDSVRQALTLLDLLWENSPEGKAHVAQLRKDGFLAPHDPRNTCAACGREELACSSAPCLAVLREREEDTA